MPRRCNAYIIDPAADSRMRLYNAMGEVLTFKSVVLHDSPKTALHDLLISSPCDMAFISSKISFAGRIDFISRAKVLSRGKDAAFVLVMVGEGQDVKEMSKNLMGGISGFLTEPYSVDQLVELTEIAAKVRLQRALDRHNMALNVLLPEIFHLVDVMALLQSRGIPQRVTRNKLKEMGVILKTLSPESLEIFYDLAEKMLSDWAPAKEVAGLAYDGASRRVHTGIEKLLLEVVPKIQMFN